MITIEEFAALTADLEWLPRGVLYSEMYLFSKICQAQGVTAIAESGVANGMSTRLLRRVWPDVTSFEWNKNGLAEDIAKTIIMGDGQVLVREWVKARPHQRLGVFVDGPKGPKATPLREWCLAQPQVRVWAQHDCPMGSGEDIHGNEPTFRRDVGGVLDKHITAKIMAKTMDKRGIAIWTNRQEFSC
jgi:hypothetical protein